MCIESVKLLIDACAEASHLPLVMPKLPDGITPRMVRVIEQIAVKTGDGTPMLVSDISEMLDVTRPGITAVVRELCSMGYITKTRDEKDGRVVYVSLTAKGLELYRQYVVEYHQKLTEVLASFGDDGAAQFSMQVHQLVSLFSSYTTSLQA